MRRADKLLLAVRGHGVMSEASCPQMAWTGSGHIRCIMTRAVWVRLGAAVAALPFLGAGFCSVGCGARTDANQASYLEDPLGPKIVDGTTTEGANGTNGSAAANANRARVAVTGFDKVDILFVVDNSLGMADKQAVLAASMPQLLRRLTNPDCIDGNGPVPTPAEPLAPCYGGSRREFAPVKDIHIGLVTSSLGDFGGDVCQEVGVQNFAMNDHGWLLGALPRAAASLNGVPFLSWSPTVPGSYEIELKAQVRAFQNSLATVTEIGCGAEMPLEAMYRFLVDPKPPRDVVSTNEAANHRDGIDTDILQMRKAFLRPDSLVVVFILSDENDCSLRDDHYAWITSTARAGFRMWRGSSACLNNPNDPCCYSCMLGSADLGVSQSCLAQDTGCRQSDAAKLLQADDDVNMRCRRMKQRFGFDFLFPPSRYVNALTLPELCPEQTYGDLDCNCTEAKKKGVSCDPKTSSKVKNPLFQNLNPALAPTGPLRPDSQAVYLTGVVGVPWQDLARDYQASPLQNRTASELDWDLFAPRVDEDYAVAELGDPFMLESTWPRWGWHPITGEPLAEPASPRATNSHNSHEWNTSNKDVQFACIFSLDALGPNGTDATHFCDLIASCGADDGSDRYQICSRQFDGCRCMLTDPASPYTHPFDPTVSLSPLCQDPWNQYGDQQYFAGAYPGLRELQVLRGFHEAHNDNKSIVGSICPKDANLANASNPDFGYNSTMKLLVDELKGKLRKE